jgi:hypothetical protein
MPTVADIEPIAAMLDHVTLGEPVRHGALTVIPLLTDKDDEPDSLTLLEGDDFVTITEADEDGVVPALSVTNAAGHCLLLPDGEELVGAKQNRILNTTVLVDAHATVAIPVSCVEQGRWAWRSRHFTASDASLFATLRAKKAGQVTQSLRRRAGHVSDQRAVWNDVGSARRRIAWRARPARCGHVRHARGRGRRRPRGARRPAEAGGRARLRCGSMAWAGSPGLARAVRSRVASPVRRLCSGCRRR